MVNNSQKNIILSDKHILNYFHTFIDKNITEIYDKFKTYKNILDIVNYLCNMIYNIFWIVFNNSRNIFLTLFLLDKSILLFTEFIILSSDPSIVKDLYYKPNIIDALNFSYKKTIHSIEISSLGLGCSKSLVNTTLLLKDMIKINAMNKLNDKRFDKIFNNIKTIFYSLNDTIFIIVYNKIIMFMNSNNINGILNFINKIKLKKNINN